MEKIKTIAIDDEPLALQLVSSYVAKTPFLDFMGGFDSPLSAMEFLENASVDLVFLDIQMPDLTGTAWARSLQNGPKIVFTTAFEKYAIEGFKLDAIDYLLKPYSYEEFLVAAQKARRQIELEHKTEPQSVEANTEFLFIRSDHKIRRINFGDILYIEGLKDYAKIFVKNETAPILSITTLKALESKLPESIFMRVHRSFIINKQHVAVIDRSRILYGNSYVPIGDQYKDKFQEFVDGNFLI